MSIRDILKYLQFVNKSMEKEKLEKADIGELELLSGQLEIVIDLIVSIIEKIDKEIEKRG